MGTDIQKVGGIVLYLIHNPNIASYPKGSFTGKPASERMIFKDWVVWVFYEEPVALLVAGIKF